MTTPHIQLADLVTSFFTRHLVAGLGASRHTIRSYRDTFRLFLRFAAQRSKHQVAQLTVDDFTPDVILDFLEHLEQKRGNSVRTRNARLAAIRSFFAYSVTQDPEMAAPAQRALNIPFKKTTGRLLGYLNEEELRALLNGPDRRTAKGRRDYLVIALLYDTGARVQEICDLCPVNFCLDCLPLVRISGKGRKQRIVPLLPATAALVRNHLTDTSRRQDDATPLLRNYRGEQMTRSGIAFLLDKYRRIAVDRMPSLGRKRVGPHTMRHTKAMHLLQAGVSTVTIKDILGHAHLKTVEVYVQADLEMKRKAMETASSPVNAKSLIYKRDPDLLRWLEQL
jgi:site-specific recombinase XerD